MSTKTRIHGACKTCAGACLYYGNRDTPTAVWCSRRNGRIINPPKNPENCHWYEAKNKGEKI